MIAHKIFDPKETWELKHPDHATYSFLVWPANFPKKIRFQESSKRSGTGTETSTILRNSIPDIETEHVQFNGWPIETFVIPASHNAKDLFNFLVKENQAFEFLVKHKHTGEIRLWDGSDSIEGSKEESDTLQAYTSKPLTIEDEKIITSITVSKAS